MIDKIGSFHHVNLVNPVPFTSPRFPRSKILSVLFQASGPRAAGYGPNRLRQNFCFLCNIDLGSPVSFGKFRPKLPVHFGQSLFAGSMKM